MDGSSQYVNRVLLKHFALTTLREAKDTFTYKTRKQLTGGNRKNWGRSGTMYNEGGRRLSSCGPFLPDRLKRVTDEEAHCERCGGSLEQGFNYLNLNWPSSIKLYVSSRRRLLVPCAARDFPMVLTIKVPKPLSLSMSVLMLFCDWPRAAVYFCPPQLSMEITRSLLAIAISNVL